MKKTITINLSGVVFHIEEDAFGILQEYISSIRTYFSSIEGGQETMADIEARIAEIFSDRISEYKQAITLEDVQALIRQMGTVSDMTGENTENSENENGSTNAAEPEENAAEGQKKLFRDKTNAVLAGVLAGIAAYFEINPLWLRLAYVALFFGFFILPFMGAFLFISYLILWIAMPGRANPDQGKVRYRKFFRSRKNQVVSGVAGGIGAYFNIDPTIIRIIFLLTLLAGGAGLIAYIILWAITPEAKSVTDEIQMEGNPINLNTIEDQIRKNLTIENPQTQNMAVKILTFPFKLLGLAAQALGPIVRFIFDAIRVFLAIILLFTGGVLLFALFVLAGASLGFLDPEVYHIQTGNFPLELITREITNWMIVFAGITALVPILIILLISLSLIFNRNLLKPLVFLAFTAIFFVGLIGSYYFISPLVHKFSSEGSFTMQQTYSMPHKLVNLLRTEGEDNRESNIYLVELELHGWKENYFQLNKKFGAQGKTYKEAQANAGMVKYDVVQQDSSLIFDAGLMAEPNAPYRAQRLEMDLYIPYNQPFTMSMELAEILQNTLYPYGYETDQIEGNTWMYTEKGLKCLTCTVQPRSNEEEADSAKDFENEDF
jgi:phage shock protein PspC (stress-responsive transcriptional regulator)